MRKILVTGGAGFVGRHVCRYFLEQSDDVICVDSIVPLTGGINPSEENWPLYNPLDYDSFKFIQQDCRDYFKTVKDTDFDYVFHLAAVVWV
jgi:GDP-L-fucose synthase